MKLLVRSSSFVQMVLLIWCVLCAGCGSNEHDRKSLNKDQCIATAKQFLNDNQPEQVISLVENYILINGSDVALVEILARACSLNNNKKLAGFYYEQSASMSDLKIFNYLKAADEYLQVNELVLAKSCYEKYLTDFPEDDYILIEYAKLLYKLQEYDSALPILIKNSDSNPELFYVIAKIYDMKRDYINSQVWYKSILEFDKHNDDVIDGLFRAAINLHDYDEILQLEGGLKDNKVVDSYDVEDIINSIKEYNLAIQNFRNARKEFSTEDKFQKHELLKAIKSVVEIKTPNNHEQHEVKDRTQLTSVEKLQKLANDIDALKNEGNFKLASDLLWKSLGIDSNNISAWIDLAYCSEKIERYDIVEVALWEALKRSQYNEEMYSQFLNIAARNHTNMEYAKLVKEAKHRLPNSADIRLMWAKVQDLVYHNQFKAIKSYKKFLQLANAQTHYNEMLAVRQLLNE